MRGTPGSQAIRLRTSTSARYHSLHLLLGHIPTDPPTKVFPLFQMRPSRFSVSPNINQFRIQILNIFISLRQEVLLTKAGLAEYWRPRGAQLRTHPTASRGRPCPVCDDSALGNKMHSATEEWGRE